ncbi:MAG: nitroreductase family protein [Desulfoferrobacter sp.]
MDLDTAIKERRSIRKYLPKELSKELLQDVLEVALWAPSGMNRQDWELVVVRGGQLERLKEIVSKSKEFILPHLKELFSEKIIKISLQVFKDFGGAPAVILVYIPKEIIPYDRSLDERGRFHLEFKRHSRLLSASALIQNLLLAAHSRGLGTCWMTGPLYMTEEINEFLGRKDKELVSLITIGYPDQSPPAPPRKEDVVHWVG